MAYKGNGFFNIRSGSWVSQEHAVQHVGQTVNGWEKRLSSNGNFYMANAAMGDPFGLYFKLKAADIVVDMFTPGRAEAKEAVSSSIKDIEKAIEIGDKIDSEILSKYNNERINSIKPEFRKLLDEAKEKYGKPLYSLEDVLEQLKRCSFELFSSNYQTVISYANQMLLSIKNDTLKIENYINKKAGVYSKFLLKKSARDIYDKVFLEYGLETYEWDCPLFFGSENEDSMDYTAYTCGSDFPNGLYLFTTLKDRASFSVNVMRNSKSVYENNLCSSSVVVNINEGDVVNVENGMFALYKYLSFSKDGAINNGMYEVGNAIKPGKYCVNCNDISSVYIIYDGPFPNNNIIDKGDHCSNNEKIINLDNGNFVLLNNSSLTKLSS